MRSLETGAPLKRKRGSSLAAEWTRYYAGWVDKIEGVTAAPYSGPSLSYTLPEPYGVIAALTPWNGGMVSAAMKVVPALAAGNCVVLKPAELAPLGPLRFAELCARSRPPAGCAQRRPGGADAGAALVGDPRVGQDQLHRRRRHRPADPRGGGRQPDAGVLELGGKSADLVFADADLDLRGDDRRADGAGEHQRSGLRAADPSARARRRLRRGRRQGGGDGAALKIGRPFDEGVQMGPVIDAANCDRILGVIDATRASGAGELLTGGERVGGDLADGYFVRPRCSADVDNASDLAQREVFGPVLSIMRFSDEDDAVALANGTEYGLGGLVFTQRHRPRPPRRRRASTAGYVGINSLPADAAQRAVRRRQAERVRARGRSRGPDGVPPDQERVRRPVVRKLPGTEGV